MKHVFVAETHEEFGMLGWRLKDMPGFDPLLGQAVAHDILEHFPDGDESPADEFRALGAAWLIRGEGGMLSHNANQPEEHIAADFPDIIAHIVHEGMTCPEPPRVSRLDEDSEESLSFIVRKAWEEVKERFSCDCDEPATAKDALRKSKGWLRVGYTQALERYDGKLGSVRAIFYEIHRAADKYLKDAVEGSELHVSVDLETGDCSVDFLEYPDDYDMEDMEEAA